MPELPDVQVWKEYLDATALHRRIVGLAYGAGDLRETVPESELEERLTGRALRSTHRHGKHLFAEIGDDGWLRFHFGMTGGLRYFRSPGKEPGHTRLRLDLENGFHLAYDCTRKLGMIGLCENPEGYVREAGLGPDALSVGRQRFLNRMGGRRGMVKSALMDQRLLAGLGNVYSDEVLFQTRLHPRAPLPGLDDADLDRLHGTMVDVLAAAVEARADPARMPSGWITPHRHPGGRCPRCGAQLESVRVSGRTAYFCPDAQAAP